MNIIKKMRTRKLRKLIVSCKERGSAIINIWQSIWRMGGGKWDASICIRRHEIQRTVVWTEG